MANQQLPAARQGCWENSRKMHDVPAKANNTSGGGGGGGGQAVKSKTKPKPSEEAVASVSTMSEIQFHFDSYPISGQISENVFIFMPLSNGFPSVRACLSVCPSVCFERVNNLSEAPWLE